MYYNRYQLYSPDPYIGGGGAESGSGKGEGEDRDYGDSGVGMTEAEVIKIWKKSRNIVFFWFFSLYGSWEPLDSLKILPRDVRTFSTIGRPHSENFFFRLFLTTF